jgi:O-glycosyl hydrolase
MTTCIRAICLCLLLLAGSMQQVLPQAAVPLPPVTSPAVSQGVPFRFVSDGPAGSGWDHGNRIARFYFPESLPALFTRTIALDGDLARGDTLSWIFTGPHAGLTVQLGAHQVRLLQRYYDSWSLFPEAQPAEGYPQKIVQDSIVPFTGKPRTLTVILDAHLAVQVLMNGVKLVEQSCLFDVERHQLEFNAPRNEHHVLAGMLLSVADRRVSVTINPSVRHQTMLGFGGSPSIPAWQSLSEAGKERYWQILKSYNLLIDREYPMGTRLKPDMSNLDDPSDASPHYYGDNFPNGEVSDFAYNRRTQELGGSVIYEMWDLPAWATQHSADNNAPHSHGVADPEAWARAMVNYCRIAKERTGRPPEIVGVQNEVDEPAEVALEMVRVLRRHLDEAGFAAVKIHMADASFMFSGTQRADFLRQHPDVWKTIDYAATHEYDYQDVFSNPDEYDATMLAMHRASDDKPYLATEICINKPALQMSSWRVAFNVGQLYHKNLTVLDAIGLLYCWLILDVEQPNFGASRSLLVPDRAHGDVPIASSDELRVLGAFSRHILRGMQRVDAASSDPDLLASAFKGDGGEETVVLLNRSTTPVEVGLAGSNVAWNEIERTSLYLENEDAAPSGAIVVHPGEIVTLSTIRASQAPEQAP